MEIKNLLERIKEEFPDKAIDISESLELLRETISDTMEAISCKVNNAFLERDFTSIEMYSNLAKQAHLYELQIEELIGALDVEEMTVEELNDEEEDKRSIPNYAEYVVDTNVEHTLYENFTHIRPHAFKMCDSEVYEVRTWQEMLLKTCELLINKDTEKFMTFESNKGMNGKKNKYFSANQNEIRKPISVLGKINIETNMSGNSIRNLILKMLKQYNIKVSEYKVHFKADYSVLNKK